MRIEEEKAKYHSSKMVRLAITLYDKAQQQKEVLQNMLSRPMDQEDLRKRRELQEMARVTHGRYSLEEMRRMRDLQKQAERDTLPRLRDMRHRLLARVKQTQLFTTMCSDIKTINGQWKLVSRFTDDTGKDTYFPPALEELDMSQPRDLERFMTLARNPDALFAHTVEVYDDPETKKELFEAHGKEDTRIDASELAVVRETLHDDREDINTAQGRVDEAMISITRGHLLVSNLKKLKQQHYGVANTIQQQFNDVLDIHHRLKKANSRLNDMLTEAGQRDRPLLDSLIRDVKSVIAKADVAMTSMAANRQKVLQQYRNWRSLAQNPNVARPLSSTEQSQLSELGSQIKFDTDTKSVTSFVTEAASLASARRFAGVAESTEDASLTAKEKDVGRTAASVARRQAMDSGMSRAEADAIASRVSARAQEQLKEDEGNPRTPQRRSRLDKSISSNSAIRQAMLRQLRGGPSPA